MGQNAIHHGSDSVADLRVLAHGERPPEAPPMLRVASPLNSLHPEVRLPERPMVSRSEPVPFTETRASVLLDLLRGLAALLVLFDHWRNMLFVDYPMLPHSKMALAAVPYLLTSAGHQAVVVFFVLSGYLVGGSVLRSMQRDSWRWGEYLLHRLVRLWIVLVPGLLLCVAWDQVGLHLHRAPLLYGGANFNHLTPAIASRLTPAVFAGNLLFLGGVRVPTLGSDGALWSLAVEFWYYLLFPLALLALRKGTPHWGRALAVCGLLGCAVVAGGGVLMSFPIWLLGAGLAWLPLPRTGPRLRRAVLLGYPLLFFATIKVRLLPGLWQDYVLGLATAAFLVVLLAERERADPRRPLVRCSRLLASFSFTLYVAHMPFMLLLTSVLAGDRRWQPGGFSLLEGFLVLAATLLYSYGLAALTEFRTERVRKRIGGWFHATRPVPVGTARQAGWIGGTPATVRETVQ